MDINFDLERPKRLGFFARIRNFFSEVMKNPKKRLVFIIILGLILIALVGTGLYFLTHESLFKNKKDDEAELQPALFQAVLDGTMVESEEAANRHPLAIMVENHTDARPQSGLTSASIIYEAIAEGGITRFMALFGENEAETVGPVRSARPYYVDWLEGYNAYYAHVGGNATALDQISSDNVFDLNQFTYPNSYWRNTSLKVSREHTMFASTLKLRDQASQLGYSTANNFNIFKFKDDPVSGTPEATALPEGQEIVVDFSSANYKVSFAYDRDTNSYKRFLAGKPHVDKVNDQQISPKNVIVMTVTRTPHTTRINEKGYLMSTVGSGKALIFIDGKEITGTWKKSSKDERELFYNESGEEITFNRGQFWVCVIPPESTVSSTITPSEPSDS